LFGSELVVFASALSGDAAVANAADRIRERNAPLESCDAPSPVKVREESSSLPS
jgi:hypothetical protein